MEIQDLIQKVRKLELKTKKLSSELFSGNYQSSFRGRGMSFSQVRTYNYGDDMRNIDWNVSSRSQDTFVKEFEEERELTFILLVDISQSMDYGYDHIQKRDIAAEVAATIAFSALKNNDKVGILFFSNKVEKYIPPKKGKTHILTIIRELIISESNLKQTDISEAIRFLQNAVKKRAVTFLISDFMECKDFNKELMIASQRHSFYAIHIHSKSEENAPSLGLVSMQNIEDGSIQWVDSTDLYYQSDLTMNFHQNVQSNKKIFERLGHQFCSINIHKPYIQKLASLFKK